MSRLLIIDGHHRGQRVGIGDDRPMIRLIVGPSQDGTGGVETQEYHRVRLVADDVEVQLWSTDPTPTAGYMLSQLHTLALEGSP